MLELVASGLTVRNEMFESATDSAYVGYMTVEIRDLAIYDLIPTYGTLLVPGQGDDLRIVDSFRA